MTSLRFLAAVFLLVAVVTLVNDATPAFYGAAPFSATTLEGQWAEMAPASLAVAKAAVSGRVGPWLWNWLDWVVLRQPTFVVFGVLALVSGQLGRRRRRVEIFVN